MAEIAAEGSVVVGAGVDIAGLGEAASVAVFVTAGCAGVCAFGRFWLRFSRTTTCPLPTFTGLACIAIRRLSVSSKSTYPKPFFLSISQRVTVPKTSKAVRSRLSVTPCEGLACFRNADLALAEGVGKDLEERC